MALERQQAEQAREQELAAQRAQRVAEQQALRKLQKNFAVRMEGFAAIDKPPKVITALHHTYTSAPPVWYWEYICNIQVHLCVCSHILHTDHHYQYRVGVMFTFHSHAS